MTSIRSLTDIIGEGVVHLEGGTASVGVEPQKQTDQRDLKTRADRAAASSSTAWVFVRNVVPQERRMRPKGKKGCLR